MKESIYTIPINEVLEAKCGCPLCTLHNTLENRWVEYITGAAMMEPDVRIQTNEKGFCKHHFEKMLLQKNRLSVALLVQTRLDYIDRQQPVTKQKPFFDKKQHNIPPCTCFVCEKVESELYRMADNLVDMWKKQEDFRTLYAQQQCLCYPHYTLLYAMAGQLLKKQQLQSFLAVSLALTKRELTALKADINAFCQLFDYRSNGEVAPSEAVTTAIERSVSYLCSGYVDK